MTLIDPLMPFADYVKAEGVSKSMLDRMHPTPAHFKAWLDSREEEDETDALVYGRIAHAVSLESRSIADICHVKPKAMKFSTVDGKKWKAEHADKPIIKEEEAEGIQKSIEGLRKHPFAGKILKHSQTELSVFWDDETFSVRRKIRIDALPKRKMFSGMVPIVDLKFCRTADKREFQKEIHNRGYHARAAYYLDTWNAARPDDQRDNFILIAIEKEPPFAIAVYDIGERSIQQGRIEYRRELSIYQHCMKSGDWFGYKPEADVIEIPEYAIEKAA